MTAVLLIQLAGHASWETDDGSSVGALATQFVDLDGVLGSWSHLAQPWHIWGEWS